MFITDLVLYRRDGRTITEDMRIGDIRRLGWPVERVIAAEWRSASDVKRIEDTSGLTVKIIAGRRYLGIIAQLGHPEGTLFVVEADGSIRHTISTRQDIRGEEVQGAFRWMEDAVPIQDGRFAGIFEHPAGNMFQIDIDCDSGACLEVKPAR